MLRNIVFFFGHLRFMIWGKNEVIHMYYCNWMYHPEMESLPELKGTFTGKDTFEW